MNVTVVARDMSVSPALRAHIEELSTSLDRMFHDVRRVAWSLRLEAGECRASCAFRARSGEYRAHASHRSAARAASLVHDKVVTQRRRVKVRRMTARRRGDTSG